jgi:hypothetical protein
VLANRVKWSENTVEIKPAAPRLEDFVRANPATGSIHNVLETNRLGGKKLLHDKPP